jgi:hypothetical protein
MEDLMRKRNKAKQDAYESQWNNGLGSHHCDYDPTAVGGTKASRHTEELYNAILKNDLELVYQKIEEGADVNFVFGTAYKSNEGYTPLMVAAHRGRMECAKALLRAGECTWAATPCAWCAPVHVQQQGCLCACCTTPPEVCLSATGMPACAVRHGWVPVLVCQLQ